MNNELARNEAKRTIKNSAGRPGLNRLYTKYYRLTTNGPLHLSRVLYKSTLFMQNKPNLPKAQMNVNTVITKDYENKRLCRCVKTNPIQTQYKAKTNPIPEKPKMNENLFATKVYENITTFRPQKNKANTNPIQTQPVVSLPVLSLPMDPYSDAPLIYRRTDGGFLLYSFGTNLTDEGGKLGLGSQGTPRMWADNGDWVFWLVREIDITIPAPKE